LNSETEESSALEKDASACDNGNFSFFSCFFTFLKGIVAGILSAYDGTDSDLGSDKGVRLTISNGDSQDCPDEEQRKTIVSISCGSDEKITVLL
jgi:hypothetical protein